MVNTIKAADTKGTGWTNLIAEHNNIHAHRMVEHINTQGHRMVKNLESKTSIVTEKRDS
jgi:cell division protein FtsL